MIINRAAICCCGEMTFKSQAENDAHREWITSMNQAPRVFLHLLGAARNRIRPLPRRLCPGYRSPTRPMRNARNFLSFVGGVAQPVSIDDFMLRSERIGKLTAPLRSDAIFSAKFLLTAGASTLIANSFTLSLFFRRVLSPANCRAQNGHQ
jgi:hypothetical protein